MRRVRLLQFFPHRAQAVRLRAALVLLGTAALLLGTSEVGAQEASTEETRTSVVFLLRHAEALYPPPEETPSDPPLNIMGQARADALARLLEPAGIEQIHSSDYQRTQQTAAPLAALLGLTVQSYDPRALEEFAEQLRADPGRHVVLGHSNTTPELVGHLGGDPGEPIDEGVEYDRLYIVTIDAAGEVTTIVQRYGDPLAGNWEELAGRRR